MLLTYIKPNGVEIQVNSEQPGVKEYVKTLGWKRKKATQGGVQSSISDPEGDNDDRRSVSAS